MAENEMRSRAEGGAQRLLKDSARLANVVEQRAQEGCALVHAFVACDDYGQFCHILEMLVETHRSIALTFSEYFLMSVCHCLTILLTIFRYILSIRAWASGCQTG